MKKIISLLCLVSCILMLFTACTAHDGAPTGMRTAADGSDGYTVYVPTEWTVTNSIGGLYSYVSQADLTGITLTYTDLAADETRTEKDFFDADKASLAAHLSGFAVTSEGYDLTVDKRSVYLALYTYKIGETVYNVEAVYTVAYGRLYLFTYAGTAERFAANEESVGKILENMSFSEKRTEKTPLAFEDENAPDGMRLASDIRAADYRFYIPESWQIAVANESTLVYASDSDRSSVNVFTTTDTKKLNAKEYFEEYKKDLTLLYPDLTVLSTDEDAPFGEKSRAFCAVYTGSYNGRAYKVRQYFTYRNMTLYTFTYTAPIESYELHTAEVDRMIEAFTLLGN